MKKTLEPKETWGDAISYGLIFTLMCALGATMLLGVAALVVMGIIAMFNVAWWLPLVLIIPVIMILVFRYTGFNAYLDGRTSTNLPPR